MIPLFIGDSAQNLMLRSEELDNASWDTNTAVTVTANTGESDAPNGTATAEKLEPTGA